MSHLFLYSSEMLKIRLFLSHYQAFVSACLVGGAFFTPSDPDLVVIILSFIFIFFPLYFSFFFFDSTSQP